MSHPNFRFRFAVKTRWLVGAGFLAGMFLAAPPLASLGGHLTGTETHPTAPVTSPSPVHTEPTPSTTQGTPPATGGDGHHSGTVTTPPPTTSPTATAPSSSPYPTEPTRPTSSPYPSPTHTPTTKPTPTGTPGPSTLLFTDTFQEDPLGSTPSIGGGTIVAEGTNRFLRAGEARIVIGRPGWTVTNVSAAVRANEAIAAIGDTNGSFSYLCSLEGSQLKLSLQTGDGFTALGTAPYASDGTGVWEMLRLETVNGQATCATGNGKAVVHASIPSSYRANAAILSSRIKSVTNSVDFDEVSISGKSY